MLLRNLTTRSSYNNVTHAIEMLMHATMMLKFYVVACIRVILRRVSMFWANHTILTSLLTEAQHFITHKKECDLSHIEVMVHSGDELVQMIYALLV